MGQRRWLLVAVVALALAMQAPVRAQQATPTPDVPAAEECQIAPITPARLHAAYAALATPPAVSTYPSADEGTPADAETIAGVTQTAREFVACLNARDLGRVLALVSDHYLPVMIATFGGATEEEIAAAIATPAVPSPPEQRTALIGVVDVRTLADGRVVAGVTGDSLDSEDPAKTPLFFFVKVGDRWLVDDILDEQTPATPTA